MIYLQVIAGLVILLFGGDLLVRGAVSLARRLDLSPLIIGLTVVAVGTSAPELVVSINAVLDGAPAIAVGNVVGSNICNVLLVLGVPALIYPIVCEPRGTRRDSVLMMGGTLIFVGFAMGDDINRWQGAVLAASLVLILIYSYLRATREGEAAVEDLTHEFEDIEGKPERLGIALGFTVLGLAGLLLGADWLIEGAVGIARNFGISEAVIGLTLVAVGTSLPELATTLVAALRRQSEVAIGNVLGSNLFNVLGIVGVTAMVSPLPMPPKIIGFDVWVMLAVSLMLGSIAFFHAKVPRLMGFVFCLAYALYVLAQFNGMSGVAMAMK